MQKPVTTTNSEYLLNSLASPRKFEELIHRIYENRIKDDLKDTFDFAYLMSGVAEKGVDVLLTTKGKNTGAVQCKRNSSKTISPSIATQEIIKFVLYYYLDKDLIHDINNFKYYFVCSGKYSTNALRLLIDFNNKIVNEKNLQLWTEQTIKRHKHFDGLVYNEIEPFLKRTLESLEINPISYNEVQGWLHKYGTVASEFFEMKKVIDNQDFTQGLERILDILDPDQEKKAKPIITAYKKAAVGHLNTVKFIGHDTTYNSPRNITVSKLYVEPNLKLTYFSRKGVNTERRNNDKKFKVHNVIGRTKHLVILGDPGAGKSLMVKNIILTIIRNKRKIGGFKQFDKHLPFRIELRKYSEERQKHGLNIISYLTLILESEYQLTNITKELVSYLVKTRPTLFIFDGLDEIFDVSQKNLVNDDIVNFISVNTNVKCIVTSRFIGYNDVSFPNEKFEEFSIQGFDNIQIDKFIGNFYLTQIRSQAERVIEIENCKKQIKSVDYNLKSNPLILSLMALLAINKVVIPDSKLEVYRSCTNTLVETRDKDEKQLKFNLKVKSKRGTFGSLAYWQYCQMTNKSIINRTLAVKQITEYLLEIQFHDNYEAEEAAKQFMKYAEGRSIYFDDNFMHKTFLEFYAADYIFTKYHNGFKIGERDKIIENHINNNSWHTVFELLVAMIDEQLVETNVLDKLLLPHLNSDDEEKNYFLVSILKSTSNIGLEVKLKIMKNTIKNILSKALNKDKTNGKKEKTSRYKVNKTFYLLQEYLEVESVLGLIKNVLKEIEVELNGEKEETIFYSFVQELGHFSLRENDIHLEVLYPEKIRSLMKMDRGLFMMNSNINKESNLANVMVNFLKNFDIETVFDQTPFRFIGSTSWIPIFHLYFYRNEFLSVSDLENELLSFKNHGLTIQIIKAHKNMLDDIWHFIPIDPEDKIISIANLFEQSKKPITDDFLEFMLLNFSKKHKNLFLKTGFAGEKFLELIEPGIAVKSSKNLIQS